MTVDRAPVLARSKRALPASQRPDKETRQWRVSRAVRRSYAEAKGGAAWTVGLHPGAAAPADASIASAPRRGGRGRILSTAKIRRLKRFRRSPAGAGRSEGFKGSPHRAIG